MKEQSYTIYGDGNNRMLVTNLNHIGTYVARIIADPRTLNHAVIIWEDEPTQLETREIGERVSGEGDALKAKRIYVCRSFQYRKNPFSAMLCIGLCGCSQAKARRREGSECQRPE